VKRGGLRCNGWRSTSAKFYYNTAELSLFFGKLTDILDIPKGRIVILCRTEQRRKINISPPVLRVTERFQRSRARAAISVTLVLSGARLELFGHGRQLCRDCCPSINRVSGLRSARSARASRPRCSCSIQRGRLSFAKTASDARNQLSSEQQQSRRLTFSFRGACTVRALRRWCSSHKTGILSVAY
jgi:hypothetical protein